MATKASQNPVYFKGPKLQKIKMRAADSQTWKAGGLCRLTDSGVVKVTALGQAVYGLFSETQNTATSSSDVWIEKIPSSQTQFIMSCFKLSTGTDTKAPSTLIGKKVGIGLSDSIYGAAKYADTAAVLKIHNRYAKLEGYRNDTSDVPGLLVVSFVDSALTNEGAGM